MTAQSIQAASASITMFHLTGLNTFLLKENGSIMFAYERDSLPDFLAEKQQEDFLFLIQEVKKQKKNCIMFTNEWELSYLASMFENAGEEKTVLIHGPFLKQTPDTAKLFYTFNIDQKKRIVLGEFFRSLKLLSTAKIQSIANVLQKVSSIDTAPLHFIDLNEISTTQRQETAINNRLKQTDEKYVELINLRYEVEKEMLHAVEKGDKVKIKDILSKRNNMFDFSDRFPNQPIRGMKNNLIIVNTLFRNAARNGGVPPFYLHHISEKFAIHIERVENLNALNKLIMVMAEEYCDLVRKRSHAGYSLLVQKALDYMSVHFSKPLNLDKLAQHCLVHPAHLSRQFKKETNITLTEYLHKLRIEEAKLLLKKERTSIEWVAGYVGFEDAAYFTRVFKKLEGITPTHYRNSETAHN
ncbi:AraC family transcriptional regulator [Bacillus taeanensis]|uniref:AraC family transcriptional regulator n=1 Tax=Bacillus taeanensis TaxID=273032 RepID=A0A366Y1H9_9BACI|nr:AraC family transcriptional regulator [Bacillus taeanensis]RBW70041.1 AraC family transcriptional regulator [Bacillus taeanensis]